VVLNQVNKLDTNYYYLTEKPTPNVVSWSLCVAVLTETPWRALIILPAKISFCVKVINISNEHALGLCNNPINESEWLMNTLEKCKFLAFWLNTVTSMIIHYNEDICDKLVNGDHQLEGYLKLVRTTENLKWPQILQLIYKRNLIEVFLNLSILKLTWFYQKEL
jgi:hypothetical protein